MAARLATGHIPDAEVSARERRLHEMEGLSKRAFIAAVREDDFAFHDLWVRHSGNDMLHRHIGRLRDHVVRASNFLTMPEEHYVKARQEHLAIVRAIRGKGSVSLEEAVQAHVGCVRDRLLTTAAEMSWA